MECYLFTEIFKSNTLQLLNATKFSQCIGRIEILYHCIFFVNERQIFQDPDPFAGIRIFFAPLALLKIISKCLLATDLQRQAARYNIACSAAIFKGGRSPMPEKRNLLRPAHRPHVVRPLTDPFGRVCKRSKIWSTRRCNG